MLDLIINFLIGLTIIGIPSLAFYKIGVDAGIERGERRQILKELALSGIIEQADGKTGKTPAQDS
ncbi:MAG: hypothetical protein ACPGSM_14195 [Thiolinea sp.]